METATAFGQDTRALPLNISDFEQKPPPSSDNSAFVRWREICSPFGSVTTSDRALAMKAGE